MKKMKLFGLGLITITTLSLIGCGGGGGGNNTPDSTTDTGITYNIKDMWIKNYSFNATLSSSQSNDNIKYLLSTTVKAKTIINGVTVTPVDIIGSIDNKTQGSSIAINSTYYYNADGIEIQNIDNTDGTICTLKNTPTPMPINAKIGDSGTGSTLECTDGTKSTDNWVLVTKDNQAAFKDISTYYTSSGTVGRTSTDYSYITADGIMTNLESIIYYTTDNLKFTIQKTIVNLR